MAPRRVREGYRVTVRKGARAAAKWVGLTAAGAPLGYGVMALLRLMLPEANKALGRVASWEIPIPDWPSPLDATLFAVGVLSFFWAGSLMDIFDAWEGDSDLRTMSGWLRYCVGGLPAVLRAGIWIIVVIFTGPWLVLAALLVGSALHVAYAYYWQRRGRAFPPTG